ncbi:hypothetical protein AVEN_119077-1 [Araneus ventricosus]|uniref:Uncharacterized protein n=1 Tax=Araneus ventricosus TaxID=182803 RepID=A0A4Y2BLU2_ARAVE|nr:hypothetical protein AVEN_119077-1 [Araneus ventricosus]
METTATALKTMRRLSRGEPPEDNIVTNMGSRFPAMLVAWLGRQFYRGMYGNSGVMEPSTPDLGDEMWDLKSTGIFLISLLGPKSGFMQMILCDVTA